MSRTVAERYFLDESLGTGPLGAVWRGREQDTSGFSRAVIIKQLDAELAANDAFMETLTADCGALMDRPHPHVEGVLDVVRTGADAYLIVDPIDGPSLKAWVEACHAKGEPAPWAQLIAIAANTLHALHGLHSRTRPLTHGGIDPTSIRLDRSGVSVITRVGVAAACDAGGVGAEALRVRAPEGTRTPSADVFAVGLLVYTVLAGASDTALLPDDLRARLMAGKPVDLNLVRDDLPAVVLGAVERALQPNPSERFDSATQLARSFELILRSLAQTTDAAALAGHVAQLVPKKKKSSRLGARKGLSTEETDQLDIEELHRLSIENIKT